MKKVLALTLAVLLLTAALPLTVFAVDNELAEAASAIQTAPTGDDVVINEVYITGDAQPVEGGHPSYDNIIPEAERKKYTYGGSTWRNMTDNTVLGSTYTFRNDKIYSLEVTLNANSGYVFDENEDNIGAHISGVSKLPNYVVQNTGMKSLYHKRIVVYYIFRMNVSTETSCIVKFYPGGGFGYKKPVAVPWNESYTLPENTPTGDGFDPPYGGTFEKWQYSRASDGISISTGAPGKKFKVASDLNVKPKWTMAPLVDTISINGLASPRWKTTPDYTVTLDGTGCLMNTAYDDVNYIGNGIEWREFNNTRVPKTRSFSNSDTRFYATIYLKAMGDYLFNEIGKVTATVNGRKANVELDTKAADPNNGKYIKVTYGYLSMTSYVNVAIPEPVAFQKLSLTADVRGEVKQNTSKNTSSYHNGICWTDETTAPGVILPADTLALPGHKYQALVSIVPKSNYEFPVDANLHTYLPECVCNGETVYQMSGYYDYIGDGIRGEDECFVFHRFSTPVEDTYTVLGQARVSVTSPVVGQAPVYQATAGGTGYTVKRIEWLNTATGATVTTAQKFEAGREYTVKVTLKADDGNRFAYSGTSYMTPVYVNGIKGYSDPFTNVFEITACYDFAALPNPYYTLSGTYQSFDLEGYTSGAITIALLQGESAKYSTTATAATGSYSIPNVASGSYTLRVSKKNHVTRDYAITVSGNTTKDVKIHPIGDINGDGKCSTIDYGIANSHARNKVLITDPYKFKCGDVVGTDKQINTADAGRINSHARNKVSLWK